MIFLMGHNLDLSNKEGVGALSIKNVDESLDCCCSASSSSVFFPVNKNPDEKFAPRTLHPFFMLSWTRKCREPSLLDHPPTRVVLRIRFFGLIFGRMNMVENLVNVTSNLPWKKVGVVPINFPEVCEYWNVPVQLWPPWKPFPLALPYVHLSQKSQKPKTDTHMDF